MSGRWREFLQKKLNLFTCVSTSDKVRPGGSGEAVFTRPQLPASRSANRRKSVHLPTELLSRPNMSLTLVALWLTAKWGGRGHGFWSGCACRGGKRPPQEGVCLVHTLAVCTQRACAMRSSRVTCEGSSLPTLAHEHGWSGAVWSWRATQAGLGHGAHQGDRRETRRPQHIPRPSHSNVKSTAKWSPLLFRTGYISQCPTSGLYCCSYIWKPWATLWSFFVTSGKTEAESRF